MCFIYRNTIWIQGSSIDLLRCVSLYICKINHLNKSSAVLDCQHSLLIFSPVKLAYGGTETSRWRIRSREHVYDGDRKPRLTKGYVVVTNTKARLMDGCWMLAGVVSVKPSSVHTSIRSYFAEKWETNITVVLDKRCWLTPDTCVCQRAHRIYGSAHRLNWWLVDRYFYRTVLYCTVPGIVLRNMLPMLYSREFFVPERHL